MEANSKQALRKATEMNTLKVYKVIISSIALFIGLIVLLYSIRGSVWAEMSNLKLIPIPERFTELYFENYPSIPAQTTATKTIPFIFTIHNVEGATTTYPYSVYFKYFSDGYQVNFATGTTTITTGGYETITAPHTFISSNLHGKVIVELTQMNQHIDILFPNTN